MAVRLALPSGEDHKGRDTIATFISKVWKIVEKSEYNKYIHWSDSGKTFVVCDYPNFAREVLPLYFKHSNFSSFVRQLNLYGFRKVAHPEQGVLAAKGQADEHLEFWHTNFRRGHPELLSLVQRKSHSSHVSTSVKAHKLVTEAGSDDLKPTITKVLGDIHLVQGRQENLMLVIDALKQDNTHLHRELKEMREKSLQQQKVINKIIQFLVHMVYKGKLPPRPNVVNQLMLTDSVAPPPSKRVRTMANEVDPLAEFYVDTPNDFLLELSPLVGGAPSPDSVTIEQLAPSPSPISTVPIVESPVKSTISSTSFSDSTLPVHLTDSTTLAGITPSTTFTNSTALTSLTPSSFSNMMQSTALPTLVPSPSTVPPLLSAAAISSPSAGSTSTLVTPSANLTSTLADPQAPSSGDNLALVPFGGGGVQLPMISEDLSSVYPLPGLPVTLVSSPHPENRMCLNGQLNHQQNGIDALPEFLTGNFNLDPAFVAEFLNSEEHIAPNYNYVDTARLLESLTNIDHDTVTDEGTLLQQLQKGDLSSVSPSTPVTPVTPSQSIHSAPGTPELEKLLTE